MFNMKKTMKMKHFQVFFFDKSKNNKSQITLNIIVYILIVLVAGLTLFLALGGIKDLKKVGGEAEVDNFVITLQSSLKIQKVKGIGSVDYIRLSVPSEINMVCFVDDKESFSPLSFLSLTKEKETYQDKNLFFFPAEDLTPVKIKNFRLRESENPLCIRSIAGKINLRLTTTGDNTLIEADNEADKKKQCIIVPGSSLGDPNNKIDILFLGYGYEDKTIFADEVNDYTSNYFFKVRPFSENKEKFNIWMIDEEQPECEVTSYIFCDSMSVNKIASGCPHDYVIILADPSKVKFSTRSSAISNMQKINTKDNRLVVLHEFGHIFADLADEYTDRYYEDWFDAEDYPNCDYENCPSWSTINGTDCIKGCSTNQFYRSIDTSVMRNYDKSQEYGILNENIIQENLEAYK